MPVTTRQSRNMEDKRDGKHHSLKPAVMNTGTVEVSHEPDVVEKVVTLSAGEIENIILHGEEICSELKLVLDDSVNVSKEEEEVMRKVEGAEIAPLKKPRIEVNGLVSLLLEVESTGLEEVQSVTEQDVTSSSVTSGHVEQVVGVKDKKKTKDVAHYESDKTSSPSTGRDKNQFPLAGLRLLPGISITKVSDIHGTSGETAHQFIKGVENVKEDSVIDLTGDVDIKVETKEVESESLIIDVEKKEKIELKHAEPKDKFQKMSSTGFCRDGFEDVFSAGRHDYEEEVVYVNKMGIQLGGRSLASRSESSGAGYRPTNGRFFSPGGGSLSSPAANMKKCRARYGQEQPSLWCEPCRKKKRCIRVKLCPAGQSEQEIDQTGMISPNVVLPRDEMSLMAGGMVSPWGGMVSPKGRLVSPRGELMPSREEMIFPRRILTPRGGIVSPRGGMRYPGAGMVALRGGRMVSHGGRMVSRRGGMVSPRGGMVSPRGGMGYPGSGMVAPRGGMRFPRGGIVSPRGGMVSSRGGMVSPKGGMVSPKGGMVSPKGGMWSEMHLEIPTAGANNNVFKIELNKDQTAGLKRCLKLDMKDD